MKTIRWGIIGAGDVAEVKSGPAFQETADSELLAVMRRNGEKAADFARRHGVPKWYDKAEDLLNNKEINAVYIATPPSSHLELTLKALDAGKDVYLEKPMCLNSEEAEKLCRAAEKSDSKLTLAHYRRYLPAFIKARELTREIGEIRFAQIRIFQPAKSDLIAQSETNWRLDPKVSGGGLFHDIAPHQLDLMLFYFGAIRSMQGASRNQSGLSAADDFVSGSIEFESGAQFQGLWSFAVDSSANGMDSCEIYGSEGKISFSFYGEKVLLKNAEGEKEFPFSNPAHIQQPMIAETVRYFLGERDNPCSAKEGLKVMRCLDSFT